MPAVYEGCGHANISSKHDQLFSSMLISSNRYCHQLMVSSSQILIYMYLMLFVQVSLQNCLSDEGSQARSRVHFDYIMVCAVPHPWTGLLSRNLKARKLILRAFSDFPRKLAPPKITRHTVLHVHLHVTLNEKLRTS
jgi:hypothetical protein